MPMITWIGEDGDDVAGPSFTTCFGRKFPKGEAVEVNDPDMVARARRNPFFRVEERRGRPSNASKLLSAASSEPEKIAETDEPVQLSEPVKIDEK